MRVGSRLHPRHGEVPDRPFRRGADPRGARGRLHRRVRGADARGPRAPRRQVAVQGPVRLRGDEPRRGAAEDLRRRRDDPDEGRGRDGRHRERGDAHARGVRRDPTAAGAARGRAPHRRQGTPRPTSSCAGSRSTGASRSSPRRVGSRHPRTRPSACSSARTGCKSAGIFKSDDPVVRAKAIVEATTHFDDPKVLADVSAGLGQPMVGISASSLPEAERLEVRAAGSGPPRWTRGRQIGVLALQGLPASTRTCCGSSAPTSPSRLPEELEGLDRLVIPGGESTAMRSASRAARAGRGDSRIRGADSGDVCGA